MKILFVVLSVTFGVHAGLLPNTPSTNNGFGGCQIGGKFYKPNQSWPSGDGCNRCYCSVYGAYCTEMYCITTTPVVDPLPIATCFYNNAHHAVGDQFKSTDGCNTCTCSSSGRVSCTEMFCPKSTCNYNGKVYHVGDMFDDKDGCNTCHCFPHNDVACTEMYCLPIHQNLGP